MGRDPGPIIRKATTSASPASQALTSRGSEDRTLITEAFQRQFPATHTHPSEDAPLWPLCLPLGRERGNRRLRGHRGDACVGFQKSLTLGNLGALDLWIGSIDHRK